MADIDPWGREQQPRRWRKFERQPESWFDWPAPDWDLDKPRYLESCGDDIIVYDSCNGFSVWDHNSKGPPPPAEMWIAMPRRPKIKRGESLPQ